MDDGIDKVRDPDWDDVPIELRGDRPIGSFWCDGVPYFVDPGSFGFARRWREGFYRP